MSIVNYKIITRMLGRLAKRQDIELAQWTICGATRSVDGLTAKR